MTNEFIHLFLLILSGYTLLMVTAWVFAWRLQFFSLVDAVWALGIGVGSALIQLTMGEISPRSLVAAALSLFWGLRLGIYLSIRLKKHYPVEDTRYEKLKQQWGHRLPVNTFLFFIFQGITQAIFTIPFLLASLNHTPFPQLNETIGALLVVMGVMGESISDSQLSRFKLNPTGHGKVCTAGLWRFSRHPNYFFEWVIWLGFGVFSLGTLSIWVSLIAPALMLYLLLFVTGVRPSEEQALKSRGDAYRNYQRETSSFVPWFSKTKTKLS